MTIALLQATSQWHAEHVFITSMIGEIMDPLMTLLLVMLTATPAHSSPAKAHDDSQLASKATAQSVATSSRTQAREEYSQRGAEASPRRNEAASPRAQREKLQKCNRQAANQKLRGYDRLDFITSCVRT